MRLYEINNFCYRHRRHTMYLLVLLEMFHGAISTWPRDVLMAFFHRTSHHPEHLEDIRFLLRKRAYPVPSLASVIRLGTSACSTTCTVSTTCGFRGETRTILRRRFQKDVLDKRGRIPRARNPSPRGYGYPSRISGIWVRRDDRRKAKRHLAGRVRI